jgi:hypothetical protein
MNLKKAIQLYEILEPYLDNLNEETSFLDFTVRVIKESTEKKDGAYARSLALMTGHSLEELAEFSSDYNINLFIKGLKENRIYELKIFCESLINGR